MGYKCPWCGSEQTHRYIGNMVKDIVCNTAAFLVGFGAAFVSAGNGKIAERVSNALGAKMTDARSSRLQLP